MANSGNLKPMPPWKPGQSGNPGGRPPMAIRATTSALRKMMVYKRWLEAIARTGEKDADRVSAIKVLITIASGEALRVKLGDLESAMEKLDIDEALASVAKSRKLKLVPMTQDEINTEGERNE